MKIKNLNLFIVLILSIFILGACADNVPPSDEDLGCDEGYAVFGEGCCEDSNDDKLCDTDGNIKEKSSADFGTLDSDDDSKSDESNDDENGGDSSNDDSSVSLSGFPRDFNRGNMLIITGSEGSAFEIKVVNNFLSAMVQKGIIQPGKVSVKLDIDNADTSKNHILFGSPCNNSEIVKLVDDCSSLVSSGKGILKMYAKDGVKILVIAGEDEEALDRATKKLLGGVSGEEVEV